MAGRIEDYALVGDLETAALIGTDGSVDWWCAPRFDSPACFAALLGDPGHGRWILAPVGKTRCTRRSYRGDTLVLDTFWESLTGTVRVTDFMPPRSPDSSHESGPRIVRVVEGIAGRVAMRGESRLRFHHGSIVPWTRALDRHTVACVAGPDAAYLSCGPGADPVVTSDRTTVEFTVTAGSSVAFVLGWRPSHASVPPTASPAEIDATLLRTLDFWNDWAGALRYEGLTREAVLRSLLTLKALTYAPTGGVVAAATASLPESIGGQRNWDYRFCWLRDSTFTLSCLLRGGFRREAMAWTDWLLRAVAGDPADLQPLYGVEGQRRLPETYADWLPGYENSRPVRFGNAAVDQFQLDIYGEVLNTVYSAVRAGVAVDPLGLGAGGRAPGIPRDALAGTRRGHLGSPGPAPPLRPLQGHGLGRRRPRRAPRPRHAACAAPCAAGRPCATRSTRRSAPRAGARSSSRSRSTTAAPRSTPPPC